MNDCVNTLNNYLNKHATPILIGKRRENKKEVKSTCNVYVCFCCSLIGITRKKRKEIRTLILLASVKLEQISSLKRFSFWFILLVCIQLNSIQPAFLKNLVK